MLKKKKKKKTNNSTFRNSLVIHWLGLQIPSAGGLDLIPGQETWSHMPKLKILHATTKIQIQIIFLEKEKKK